MDNGQNGQSGMAPQGINSNRRSNLDQEPITATPGVPKVVSLELPELNLKQIFHLPGPFE